MSESHSPEQEVVDICRELIRIDTSNYGDGSGPGERKAAEYVAGLLADAGLDPVLLEKQSGTRQRRRAGARGRPGRPPLLVHGHLDVVPARAEDWARHPFAAEEADGCLWGRGAVDMKDMDAMILACVRAMARSGRRPPRDVVLAFTADEEAGGRLGAHWLVDHHPDLFDGVEEAISEVGGFCVTVAAGGSTCCRPRRRASSGCAWSPGRGRATARSSMTTTRSPGSPAP
jgi:acetylornithine deacetylase/succinyl-diaminopimelate desuccinylase-like protein